MYPILFTIGSARIASFSIFLILAWCVFSFVFWKSLRDEAVLEERIFDLTFYGTIAALVAARAWYIISHWSIFSSALIKIPALWVAPGLSLMAGIIGALIVVMVLSKRMKLRLGLVLDGIGVAFSGALIVGSVGSFLDGGMVGRAASVPWAVRYIGLPELRHPYQLYMLGVLVLILVIVGVVSERAKRVKWPLGSAGLTFFILWSLGIFALEFTREPDVYWYRISADQWIALLLFFGTMSVWYRYAGGKFVVANFMRGARGAMMRLVQKMYAR
ncbi:MAG: prolipoprotein diacylglyceryl transferase family protein [Patescibacteria group bacterium]